MEGIEGAAEVVLEEGAVVSVLEEEVTVLALFYIYDLIRFIM